MVVAGTACAGTATGIALLLTNRASLRLAFADPLEVGIIFCLFLLAWFRPVLVQRRGQSEGVQFDEGLLIAGILLLPAPALYATCLVAAVCAQIAVRRSLIKSVFNVSQVSLSVGIALLLAHLIDPRVGESVTLRAATAALSGGAVSALASALAVAVVLLATRAASFKEAFGENKDLRLQTFFAGAVLGLLVATAARHSSWELALVPAPFLVLRYAIAGQFAARHDSDRVRGLLQATLSVQESMEAERVLSQICDAVPRLLACNSVTLGEQPQPGAELVARLAGDEQPLWLSVEDRVGSQAFSPADRQLLEALAAVGATALAHAKIYAAARRHEDELSAIMTSLAEGVVAFDETGKPVFINRAAEVLLGLSADEIAAGGTSLGAADALAAICAIARKCLRQRGPVEDRSTSFARPQGGQLPVTYTCTPIMNGGSRTGAVLAFRDITERVAAEQELEFSAFHDQLTCLANRRLFLDRLEQALLRGGRSRAVQVVLFADVDRFKLINDNLGHAAGDELLCEIASRLSRA